MTLPFTLPTFAAAKAWIVGGICVGLIIAGGMVGWSVGRVFLRADFSDKISKLEKKVSDQALEIQQAEHNQRTLEDAATAAGLARAQAQELAAELLRQSATRSAKADKIVASNCADTIGQLWELRQ